jgi:hypothetical protein
MGFLARRQKRFCASLFKGFKARGLNPILSGWTISFAQEQADAAMTARERNNVRLTAR